MPITALVLAAVAVILADFLELLVFYRGTAREGKALGTSGLLD